MRLNIFLYKSRPGSPLLGAFISHTNPLRQPLRLSFYFWKPAVMGSCQKPFVLNISIRITVIQTDHNCNRNIANKVNDINTWNFEDRQLRSHFLLARLWYTKILVPIPLSILLAGGVSSCLLDNIGMLLEEVVFWWLCLSAVSSALPAPLWHPSIRASSHKTPWRLTVQN